MDPVRYPVRTPLGYWLVVGVLCGLAAVGGYVCVLALAHGIYSWKIFGLGGLIVVLPVVYVLTTPEYRARGELCIGQEHVEVPDRRGVPVRLRSAGLELTITRVSVRFLFTVVPVGEVQRGMVLGLREGPKQVKISTLTLVDPQQAEALVEDLERVRRGLPPQGPRAPQDRVRARPCARATSTRRSSIASSRRWTDAGPEPPCSST